MSEPLVIRIAARYVRASDLAREFEQRVEALINFKGKIYHSNEVNSEFEVPPKNEIKELHTWLINNFHIKTTRAPKGFKSEKEALERFDRLLVGFAEMDGYMPGAVSKMIKNAWEDQYFGIKRILPRLVQGLTTEGGAKEILREKKVGSNIYINLVGASEKNLDEMISTVETSFDSLKGWRKKALEGGITVNFAGPKEFRGTASGSYKRAEDTLWIRATPGGRIQKAEPGKYGSLGYVIVHELGHRYENKRHQPFDFDRSNWYTSSYSKKDNEAFAELFALSNFDIRGQWGEVLDRFDALMEGKDIEKAVRVAARFIKASYMNIGDLVLYGKYKNHKGKIVGFGEDHWGNPTVEVEPIPKGRKQNKVFGLFRIWRADVKENALKKLEQKVLTASEDQALMLHKSGGTLEIILYRPSLAKEVLQAYPSMPVAGLKQKLVPAILAAMGCSAGCGGWTIDRVAATPGGKFGRFLYEVALSITGGLMASRGPISASAKKVWEELNTRSDLKKIPVSASCKTGDVILDYIYSSDHKPGTLSSLESAHGRFLSSLQDPNSFEVGLLGAAPKFFSSRYASYDRRADLTPPLGEPGGPCQVVQRIDQQIRSPRLKENLIDDVQKGESLSNPDASKVYDIDTEPGIGPIKKLRISSHAQYRMDLRRVTVADVRENLKGFLKALNDWKSQRHPAYERYSTAMSSGQKVEWIDPKSRLSLVFAMSSSEVANIITTFWKGVPDPHAPGECGV